VNDGALQIIHNHYLAAGTAEILKSRLSQSFSLSAQVRIAWQSPASGVMVKSEQLQWISH